MMLLLGLTDFSSGAQIKMTKRQLNSTAHPVRRWLHWSMRRAGPGLHLLGDARCICRPRSCPEGDREPNAARGHDRSQGRMKHSSQAVVPAAAKAAAEVEQAFLLLEMTRSFATSWPHV